jgi:integrase
MKGEIIDRGKNRDGLYVWQIRIFLGRRTVGGKIKKVYHFHTFKQKVKSIKEVNARLAELLTQFNRGELAEPHNLTVERYLDRWLQESVKVSVSKRTFYDYDKLCTRYIKPKLGHLRLIKLTALDVQALYNELIASGLSPRTVHYTHAVLSGALGKAVKWNFVPRNVAKLTDLPKGHSKEMNVLTPDQAVTFLEHAEGDRYYALWMLALDTGMRPEEYLGLQWGDIQNGVVSVKRVLCRDSQKKEFYFDEPKTPKSRRRIPITPATAQALEAHRRNQLEERLARGPWYKNKDNLVFTNIDGSHLYLTTLRKNHFKPILAAAGLPDNIRIYDLRHTMATIALLENMHPKKVQDRLGHSSYQLTMDTYSHILPQMQNEVRNALDHSIFSKLNKKS